MLNIPDIFLLVLACSIPVLFPKLADEVWLLLDVLGVHLEMTRGYYRMEQQSVSSKSTHLASGHLQNRRILDIRIQYRPLILWPFRQQIRVHFLLLDHPGFHKFQVKVDVLCQWQAVECG